MNISLAEAKILEETFAFSRKHKKTLYVVGGFLRDKLIKRKKANPDIDFYIRRNALSFGRALADHLRAGFVVLDKEHGACRVVKKAADKIYTLDFSDSRGASLELDLYHRDFTINSLAISLEDMLKPGAIDKYLIDRYCARIDIKKKIIRMVCDQAFDEDPLRILRSLSQSAMFDFKVEKQTLRLVKAKRVKLRAVSAERVRDELFKILDTDKAYESFLNMDKLGILDVLFPEFRPMRGVNQGPYHHLDIWKHSLESLRQMEMIIQAMSRQKAVKAYLEEEVSFGRRRKGLMKMACLLHDIGKPQTLRRRNGKFTFYGHDRRGMEISEGILRRLKLSNDEINALKKIVFWHLRPGYLADSQPISERAKFRYFRDAASEALAVLLVSLADQRSTRGRLTTPNSRQRHEDAVALLMKEYFQRQKEKKFTRLVNGNDLMRRFKLPPSKLIGKMLRDIDELTAIGKIKSKEEAFKAARRHIHA